MYKRQALTQDQARLLKRYVNNVYVSYDGDEAGKKATLRALDILAQEGIETRVVSIPAGQDPDEFLKKYGRDGYLKLMKSSLPLMDYKFQIVAQKYDLGDGYQKEKFAKECVAPVSYTHLDVYKRQAGICGRGRHERPGRCIGIANGMHRGMPVRANCRGFYAGAGKGHLR